MKAPATVLLLLLAAFATPCLAQIPILTSEFKVDASPPSYQFGDAVATGRDGRFIVTWTGEDSALAQGATAGVFRRPFDVLGAPESDPLPAESDTTGSQGVSDVARDASGAYVVVWTDYPTSSVKGRRFDPAGQPRGDDFTINTSAGTSHRFPHVASDDAGNFVVVWTRNSAGPGQEIRARRFDSQGMPLSDDFAVNVYTTGNQAFPDVAMAPGGGFVASWGGEGMTGPGIWARTFDADGVPVTGDFQVNLAPLVYALRPTSVGMGGAGQFIVVWDDLLLPVGPFTSFGRRFDGSAAPLGPPFPVSPPTADSFDPQVAMNAAGHFVVAWTAAPPPALDGDGTSIDARYFDAAGNPVSDQFQVNQVTTGYQFAARVDLADDGGFVVAWTSGTYYAYEVKGRKSAIRASGNILVDPAGPLTSSPTAAPANGVFEPGETVTVETAWVNDSAGPAMLAGAASNFTGPAGATYTIDDGTANYGTVAASTTGSCVTAGDCFSVTVSAPAVRPAAHWDASFLETLNVGVPKTWTLHVGESFPDAPTGNIFYAFIETLFHNGVTGGCAGGNYCPTNPVTRAQMAVFLLKSKFGSAHIPPPCTGTVFTDVPCTGGPFDPWIEELAALQITGGCGGGLYCPGNTVTRQQMAVFLLKALLGSGYVPPPCAGDFDDVPCPSQFADWIEDLFGRSITGGCSVAPPLYCPTNPNNRGQMAVFLVKTFGLVLYGGS